MEIWLSDSKTGIECGINEDGNLFIGINQSGSNLTDTLENRQKILEDFCRYTGREKPVTSASGAPIKYEGSIVEFSR